MKMLNNLINHNSITVPSRRGFLKMVGGAAGASLLMGFDVRGAHAADAAHMFTPFVRLDADGKVTVLIKHLDKGQGIATGLATLVAEELDAAPAQMAAEFAPADPKYNNLFWGVQGTGGSTSIANSFEQYRKAGAAVRAVLMKAAARKWQTAPHMVRIEGGVVSANGKKTGFGELLALAAKEEIPAEVALKKPADWRYIGKSFPRVDAKSKSTGAVGQFAMDFQPKGYVVAAMVRPPRWGATLKSFDAAAAKAVKGVIEVIKVGDKIAVIADATWPAFKAKGLIEAEWDFTNAENRGSDQLLAEYHATAAGDGLKVERRGDAAAAMANADRVKDVSYEFPFLAHAPMEPLDVTVQFDGKKAHVWTGSQIPPIDQGTAAHVLGLDPANVTVTPMWAGGSFGRRAVGDAHFVAEAALVAKAWGKKRPVKLVWTREDDITGGYYRPLYVHKAKLGFDETGALTAWQHHIVGQSIVMGTPFEAFMVHDGVDHTVVEGVMHTTYDVPNMALDVTQPKVGVPPLWWRSVGHTHTAYVMETLVDVMAKEAGQDPVAYRRAKMKDDPRRRAVLDMLVEKAGWHTAPAAGRYRGIAVHASFGSFVGQVAEISLEDGTVKVEKVTCVVDCGLPVNPDNIKAQMEGGIGFGLGAILRNEITLTNGEVDQQNFDLYNPLRMEDMPDIEVHIMPSDAAPTGVGEPGVPPIGPAVANAVFAATGDMPTRLPFSKAGLSL